MSLIRVKIAYFAALRDQSSKAEESREIEPQTVRELYLALCEEYGFDIAPRFIQFAVNCEFVETSKVLQDGDSVVFIPPVSGG